MVGLTPYSFILFLKYSFPSLTNPPCTQAQRTPTNVTAFGLTPSFTILANSSRHSSESPCIAKAVIMALQAITSFSGPKIFHIWHTCQSKKSPTQHQFSSQFCQCKHEPTSHAQVHLTAHNSLGWTLLPSNVCKLRNKESAALYSPQLA
ncbi:hypothetical protein JHK85_003089 [Glycine max]|uniref:Uncharacterized protein n=1 Tax=Glycine max TaxID=3847 RepID=A0A0R0KXQ2_SOYBN|nr:hypothetical protein JHK87_054855 [Glycine soja]KAG5061906.1 hypothetical protein JHK85_003089 [Glycine max]KAG5078873.1 hypothetical protein JHK86_002938 [Glycine max]KAH1058298.1 hypothetical protein GYH30_002731 [Glycine max]